MSKPVKTSRTPAEILLTEVSVSLEKWGAVDYLSDFRKPTPAIESLATAPPNSGVVVTMGNDSPPETTVILKKGSAYYVYFHTCELSTMWWGANLDAFTAWAMSLTADDTVYFYQTGNVYLLPHIIQALVVLDTQCLAKTVFVVDHIIETPLWLLVCKDILVEDTGAIAFSNCIPDDARKCEQVFRPYLRRLYTRAVSCTLLSETEVKSIIEDDAIVFKTARELRVIPSNEK